MIEIKELTSRERFLFDVIHQLHVYNYERSKLTPPSQEHCGGCQYTLEALAEHQARAQEPRPVEAGGDE